MSPAGYWPQLQAAVEAGADAVYFGLKHFTARAKVGFELDELPAVMRALRTRGVRGYVTFNTLVFDEELPEAARVLAAIIEAGADAVIVQDVGAAGMLRAMAPEVPLHASTQMSVTSAAGVRFAQRLGASRVTLARELSLEQIRAVRAAVAGELEIFAHGALCVSYSGQCLSSEAWGGRSANRGLCAQGCRLPYDLIVDGARAALGDARYLLSPGDLYALRHIPEIVSLGIAALKIEGRYKDAAYVALVTRAYRQAVDEAWAGRPLGITPAEELQLEQVYSRGLGAHFLEGTNHQRVVRGRAPRHRGVEMGRVTRVTATAVFVEPAPAHAIAPLKPGDGVVFDAADWRSPEEPEEGGRLFDVTPAPGGQLELRFGNSAVKFARIRRGDLLWRTDDPHVEKAARPYTTAATPLRKQPVIVRVTAAEGEPLVAEWAAGGVHVTVASPQVLEAARAQGLTSASLREQFGRLGDTPYELADLHLDIRGAPFAPVSILNDLRRRAVEQLREAQALPPRRTIQPVAITPPGTAAGTLAPRLHLLVRSPAQLAAALALRPASITLDYLDLYGLRPSIERVKAAGIEARVASPRVLKPGEERITDFLRSLDCGILIRSAGLLEDLRGAPCALTGDASLNVSNYLSAARFFDQGIERLAPAHDLNGDQVARLARHSGAARLEAVVYHHLPVFHTEHCVFARFLSNGTTHENCGRPCDTRDIALADPSGRAHPVMADVGCRNTVFSAEAQDAGAHIEAWLEAGIRHFRLEFVHESADEVARVSEAFRAAPQGSLL